jgi:uncharacterized protein YjbI with pentapeptide repeats
MKLKEYASFVSEMSAPEFDGNIRVVLIKHFGWLNGKSWGKRAKLNYADLDHAELNYADLDHAELNYAKLDNAELNYAKLNYADLDHAELNYADLDHAELNYAKLDNAKLNHAKLNGAELNGNAFSLTISKYQIIGTKTHIHIGCKRWEWSEDLSKKAKENGLESEWERVGPIVMACAKAIGVTVEGKS